MDPLSFASLATTAVKQYAGIAQMLAGKRILRNSKLPEYNIAPEYQQNIDASQSIKNMGMPAESYNNSQRDIYRSLNFGVNTLGARRAAVAGVVNLVQRSMDATNNLNAMDANMRRSSTIQGTQMEMGARQQLALQKLAKQQWEKMNPYLRKMQEGQALIGAGMQNFVGGGSDLGQMMMQGQPSDYSNLLRKWGKGLQKSISVNMANPLG